MIRPGWISDPIPVDIAQLPELLPADAVPVRLQVPASRRAGHLVALRLDEVEIRHEFYLAFDRGPATGIPV